MASASVLSVNRVSMFCLTAPCLSRLAKVSARWLRSPTMMREGWRLSCRARPSRGNSGEKIRLGINPSLPPLVRASASRIACLTHFRGGVALSAAPVV